MNGQAPEPTAEGLPKQELHCLKGHDGPVLAVRFNRTGTYCLSCGKVGHSPLHAWHVRGPTHVLLN